MFRRIERGLIKDHPDPSWPADLKELGYFITDSGHIRKIDKPTERFQYFITNHDRYNNRHREAMEACVRREVDARMFQVGLRKLYCPQLTNDKPKSEPHIPIYAPTADTLRTKKRVVLFINDNYQDLGVYAYRTLYGDGGLDGGSCVSLVKDLIARSPGGPDLEAIPKSSGDQQIDPPGVVVLNPGQLCYSHQYNCAMTNTSWLALPRASIAHPDTYFDGLENTVSGHRSVSEHVETVLEKIVLDERFIAPDAEIYIVAIAHGAEAVVEILDENWAKYGQRLTGLALIDPVCLDDIRSDGFRSFLKRRTRAWVTSEKPANTLVRSPFKTLPQGTELFDVRKGPLEEIEPEDKVGDDAESKPIDWLETITVGLTRQQVHQALGFNDTKSYLVHVKDHGLESALQSAGNSMINLRSPQIKNAASDSSKGGSSAGDSTSTQTSSKPAWTEEEARLRSDTKGDANEILFPTFSGGNEYISEVIFPNVRESIIDFFEAIAQDPAGYLNPELTVRETLTTTEDGSSHLVGRIEGLDINRDDQLGETNGDAEVDSADDDEGEEDEGKGSFGGSVIDTDLLVRAGLGAIRREPSVGLAPEERIQEIED